MDGDNLQMGGSSYSPFESPFSLPQQRPDAGVLPRINPLTAPAMRVGNGPAVAEADRDIPEGPAFDAKYLVPESVTAEMPDLRANTMAPPPAGSVDFLNYPQFRKYVFERAKTAFQNMKPIENAKYQLTLEDVDYHGQQDYSREQQVQAEHTGNSLNWSLKGRYVLTDKETGKVVNRSGRRTIMNVPYMTDEGTFIRNGVPYAVLKQFRMAPAVFTYRSDNDTVESQFNVKPRTGTVFKVFMDPESSVYYMRYQGRKIPMYPLLARMGMSHEQFEQTVGKDIAAANRAQRVSPQTLSWFKQAAEKGRNMIRQRKIRAGEMEAPPRYVPPANVRQLTAAGQAGVLKDAALRWRAETGIELLPDIATKAEDVQAAWNNWMLMSSKQKEMSDKQSVALYGKTNEERMREKLGITDSNV